MHNWIRTLSGNSTSQLSTGGTRWPMSTCRVHCRWRPEKARARATAFRPGGFRRDSAGSGRCRQFHPVSFRIFGKHPESPPGFQRTFALHAEQDRTDSASNCLRRDLAPAEAPNIRTYGALGAKEQVPAVSPGRMLDNHNAS